MKIFRMFRAEIRWRRMRSEAKEIMIAAELHELNEDGLADSLEYRAAEMALAKRKLTTEFGAIWNKHFV